MLDMMTAVLPELAGKISIRTARPGAAHGNQKGKFWIQNISNN
jgi:hypothetical protein